VSEFHKFDHGTHYTIILRFGRRYSSVIDEAPVPFFLRCVPIHCKQLIDNNLDWVSPYIDTPVPLCDCVVYDGVSQMTTVG
jgi:hypothetical protein